MLGFYSRETAVCPFINSFICFPKLLVTIESHRKLIKGQTLTTCVHVVVFVRLQCFAVHWFKHANKACHSFPSFLSLVTSSLTFPQVGLV